MSQQEVIEIIPKKEVRDAINKYNKENNTKFSLCFTRGTLDFYLQEFGKESSIRLNNKQTKEFLYNTVLLDKSFFFKDFYLYDGDHADVFIFIARR